MDNEATNTNIVPATIDIELSDEGWSQDGPGIDEEATADAIAATLSELWPDAEIDVRISERFRVRPASRVEFSDGDSYDGARAVEWLVDALGGDDALLNLAVYPGE